MPALKERPAKETTGGCRPRAKAEPKHTPREKEIAQTLDLRVMEYRVLKVLKSDKPLTYREIEEKTGYHKHLTPLLRADKPDGLTAKGLAKQHEKDGKLYFTITAKGSKLLEKAKAPAKAPKAKA